MKRVVFYITTFLIFIVLAALTSVVLLLLIFGIFSFVVWDWAFFSAHILEDSSFIITTVRLAVVMAVILYFVCFKLLKENANSYEQGEHFLKALFK